MPPAGVRASCSFSLRVGDEPGWEALQAAALPARLPRASTSSARPASTRYAAASSTSFLPPPTRPVRFEFFGDDDREHPRVRHHARNAATTRRRSRTPSRSCRGPKFRATTRLARGCSSASRARPNVVSAARALHRRRRRRPRGLARARLRRARDAARLSRHADGSSSSKNRRMLATIERGLDDERSREERSAARRRRSRANSTFDEDEVGEALLARGRGALSCGWPTSARARASAACSS